MAHLRGSSTDTEIRHLKTEVQTLQAELTQCQSDKDFVWSLWKRLQVSEPDVTQSIGLVMLREKEKNDTRDRQVLMLLDAKDQYINELEETLNNREEEITSIMNRKVDYENKVAELEGNLGVLRQHMEGITSQQGQLVDGQVQQTVKELEEKLAQKNEEVEKLKSEQGEIKNKTEKDKETVEYKQLRKKLRKLSQELKEKDVELEKTKQELKDVWEAHIQTTGHVQQQAGLIRQLQQLQSDTDKMLKSTENACSIETQTLKTENEQMRLAKIELCQQLEQQEKMIHTRDELIKDLEDMVLDLDPYAQVLSRSKEVQFELPGKPARSSSWDSQRDWQSPGIRRRKHSDPGSRRSSFSASTSRGRSRSSGRNPKSLSAINERRTMFKRLQESEKRLDETKAILKAKVMELRSLKTAHDRRFERLRSLQQQHKLVKEQLQAVEEELNGPKKRTKKSVRPHAKQLQNEDSDAVWNEVTYLRKENRNLCIENVNLQEERDSLSVKLAGAEGRLLESKSELQRAKKELTEALESNSQLEDHEDVKRLESLLVQTNHSEERLKERLAELEGEIREMQDRHTRTLQEKRLLADELNSIKQEEQVNIELIAGLRQELDRLKRQREEALHQTREAGDAPLLSPSYRNVKDYTVHHHKARVDDSEGGELNSTDHTHSSANSLGRSIAIQASMNDSQNFPSSHRSTQTRAPSHRSVALSPIRYTERIHQSLSDTVLTREQGRHASRERLADQDNPLAAREPTREHYDAAEQPTTSSLSHDQEAREHGVSGKSRGSGNRLGHSRRLSGSRSVMSLKQRVTALQHQVVVLRDSKRNYASENSEMKATLQQTEAELGVLNQRLNSNRTSLQHMTSEVDRLKCEKAELQRKVEFLDSNKRSEHEWAGLQQRHKSLTSDLSRQQQQIRDLRAENEKLMDKVGGLQDRVKSLERDCSQKKILTDELRGKLRIIEENSQTNNCLLEEKTNMINSLSDTNQRLKTQMESLKQRLSASKEGKESTGEKIQQLAAQVDKKTKQATELQAKLRKSQNDMASLERAVQTQFNALADQSEAAMEAAQKKLQTAATKIHEFYKFVKKLENYLEKSLDQESETMKQLKKDLQPAPAPVVEQPTRGPVDEGYGRSCQILGMTPQELEDFMSMTNSRENSFSNKLEDVGRSSENKKEAVKKKHFEKLIAASKAGFSEELLQLVKERVEERCDLIKQELLALTSPRS